LLGYAARACRRFFLTQHWIHNQKSQMTIDFHPIFIPRLLKFCKHTAVNNTKGITVSGPAKEERRGARTHHYGLTLTTTV
jgi:hypothetical protein